MYHGKLVFPANFPFRPPAIFMMTPSGRFQTNTRLCLSISDYHPDTWNPAWTVSTIITGLLSFMNDNQPTLGSLTSTDEEKQRFAKLSKAYNLRDSKFCRLFPDIAEQIRKEIAENRVNEDRSAQETPNRPRETTSGYSALLSNLIALAGCVILAYAVKYVVQTAQEQEGRFK
ncbi:hypothetical protein WR25_02257 isoform C [Diploscapter pachys]|nr:hypothetical protein WR25_02257 isoform B [Diploscapter pachys]PAV84710.1 hypothetical protein WR25_02257 isoform C [Diploscapter pachys]